MAGTVEPQLRQLMLSSNDVVRRWATFAVCRILDQSERKDANVELAALLATITDWPTEPDSTGDYSTGIVNRGDGGETEIPVFATFRPRKLKAWI